MAIFTSVVLAYVVATSPVPHLRFVDKLSSVSACEKVIEKVAEAEANNPVDERIAPRLTCLLVSYKMDTDDDGPSKPVNAPAPQEPTKCFHPTMKYEVKCKEA